jgi:membrane-associated phospholipid phosphatase
MNVASAPSPLVAAHDSSDAMITLAGALTTAYLAVMTLPMWSYMRMTGATGPFIAHLATVGLGAAALGVRAPRVRWARDWLVLLVGPFMYIELRWLIPAIGRLHRDGLVMAWEARLFPSNPSATLALRWHELPLSEALHAAYASYYLLVYLTPIVLYARGERRGFATTMLAYTIAYGTCFIVFVLFPVDGPRYLVGAAAAPAGPVRAAVLALLEHGSSRGTAFPSSHVAAAMVSALCALQFSRRVGAVIAVFAAALTLATVYGGFHYAVDAVAGVMLGSVAWLASNWLWRSLRGH